MDRPPNSDAGTKVVLSTARSGDPILISKKVVGFSYFPAEKPARYFRLKPLLFTTNPWGLIDQSIKTRCPKDSRSAALAFLRQAEDNYFAAGSAGVVAAKPVLLYYSYLNLAKALILTRGLFPNLDSAVHGIKDRRHVTSSKLITSAYVEADPAGGHYVKVFNEFLKLFRGTGVAATTQYDLSQLMPQAVPGHRMWASASSKAERMLAVESVDFLHDSASKTAWMSLSLLHEDVSRIGKTHSAILNESLLASQWEQVKGGTDSQGKPLLTLQMKTPLGYSVQPAEKIADLVSLVRPNLRSTVLSTPPYRRYYLYLAPSSDQTKVLPEMVAIYALAFYLGSITRYRPHHFDAIADGPYGRFVQSCLSDHPSQFLYLMASEFAEQEITKPAIV